MSTTHLSPPPLRRPLRLQPTYHLDRSLCQMFIYVTGTTAVADLLPVHLRDSLDKIHCHTRDSLPIGSRFGRLLCHVYVAETRLWGQSTPSVTPFFLTLGQVTLPEIRYFVIGMIGKFLCHCHVDHSGETLWGRAIPSLTKRSLIL